MGTRNYSVWLERQHNRAGRDAVIPGASGGIGAELARQLAAAMVALINQPRPEIYTDPAQAELAPRYQADEAAIEATLGR